MHGNTDADTVDLRELGAALRHGWVTVLIGAVLGAGLGYAAMLLVPAKYEATSKVLVRGTEDPTRTALNNLSGLGSLVGKGAGAGGGVGHRTRDYVQSPSAGSSR